MVASIASASYGLQAPFSLWIDDLPQVRVVALRGTEAISALYEFEIDIAAGELDLAHVVGAPATLQLDGLGPPRLVHGEVCRLEYTGETRRHQLYRLVLVPRLWRLQHRHGCRVFQNRTTPEIVVAVLRAAGFARSDVRLDLTADYAPRNYCVQYRESDLAFISRLLEEDGIFYFFEHDDTRATLVLADHGNAHPPIPGDPTVWFHAGGQQRDREHLTDLRLAEQVRPGRVSLRDFNFHEPAQLLDVSARAGRDDDLEIYDYPGEFQHPGSDGPHQGRALARLRLEELQVTRRRILGTGDCMRMTPGHHFTAAGHRRADLNTDLLITRVTHEGTQPQATGEDSGADAFRYRNHFECIPRDTPFRPPRITPRPFVHGIQSATVVGPAQEEIHVDEQGRVLVQFHWDREGRADEHSSCWVRVSQAWAGPGYGAVFIPRVGHEVLVDFIEGDPDRPIITGRVYHAGNTTPYPLPEEKTRSTIRTESSPGGGGYNELRFEDRKGDEEIFLHAQRDLREIVLHDNLREVKADQIFRVGGSQQITVTGDRSVTVTRGDESLTVCAGSSTTTIERDRRITVNSGDSELTVAAGTHTVTAMRAISTTSKSESVAVTAFTSVHLKAQSSDFTAHANDSVRIGAEHGRLTLESRQSASLVSRIGGLSLLGLDQVVLQSQNSTLDLKSHEKATLSSDDAVDIQATHGVWIHGCEVEADGKKVALFADEQLTLRVGQSMIILRPDGITLSAPKITSTAIGIHEISGALIRIN